METKTFKKIIDMPEELPPVQKLILLTIARYINTESGKSFPSIRRISDRVGVSQKYTSQLLKVLAEKGYIKRQRITDSLDSGYWYIITIGDNESSVPESSQTGNISEDSKKALSNHREENSARHTEIKECLNERSAADNNAGSDKNTGLQHVCDPKTSIDSGDNERQHKFVKPTIEQIAAYCKERQNDIDAEYFYSYYESIGWMVGRKKMKDWKAAVRTWEKNDRRYKEASATRVNVLSDNENLKYSQLATLYSFIVKDFGAFDQRKTNCSGRLTPDEYAHEIDTFIINELSNRGLKPLSGSRARLKWFLGEYPNIRRIIESK